MPLYLFNTLTNRLEPFQPLEGNTVRMYTCGPTVYDYAHIGNFRTFVFQDILRRYLRYCGYQLHHVMNITDVEDKIIRNAGQTGKSLQEYTEFYIRALEEDNRALRLEPPDKVVLATEHIPEMVDAIQKLGERGMTYQSDGSIYYRIAGFPGYGKLSKIDVGGMRVGARVTWTNTTRLTPGTSPCGRRPSPASLAGTHRSGAAGRAGTSSARSCR